MSCFGNTAWHYRFFYRELLTLLHHDPELRLIVLVLLVPSLFLRTAFLTLYDITRERLWARDMRVFGNCEGACTMNERELLDESKTRRFGGSLAAGIAVGLGGGGAVGAALGNALVGGLIGLLLGALLGLAMGNVKPPTLHE